MLILSSIIAIIRLLFCAIKYIYVYIVLRLGYMHILKSKTWLVSEKRTEARDNGFHMFRFLRESTEEKAFYAITYDSADYNKIKALGNVVKYNSIQHIALYLGSKYLLYGQIDSKPYENLRGISRLDCLRRRDQIRIYLKHGIAKDDIWTCDYRQGGYDILICGAKPEYEYYKTRYSYPDKHIAYTGMCRYDGLIDKSSNCRSILLMPTFRNWLRASDSTIERANSQECKRMEESDFYKRYKSLLTNKRLIQVLHDHSFKLLFYLHYTIQPYVHMFEEFSNENIVVCKRGAYDVQELLNNTNALVTDYSSVAFDFAYMFKPLIYYQFDVEMYRSEQYKKGYFDYELNGFGPLVHDEESVVDWVEKIICNRQFNISGTIYERRTQDFFEYHDNNNCLRVYNIVKSYT